MRDIAPAITDRCPLNFFLYGRAQVWESSPEGSSLQMTSFPCLSVGDALDLLAIGAPSRPAKGTSLDGGVREIVETVDPLLLVLMFAGYYVEKVNLWLPDGKKTYSVDTRTWSVVRAETLPWHPPAGEAIVALWTRPRYFGQQTKEFCFDPERLRSPELPAVEVGFAADLPGWMILRLGKPKNVAAALAPLSALVIAFSDRVVPLLVDWQTEVTAPRGLMRLYEAEAWGLQSDEPDVSYPAIAAFRAHVGDLVRSRGVFGLLSEELVGPEEKPVTLTTRLAEGAEADADPPVLLAELADELAAIQTAQQDNLNPSRRPSQRINVAVLGELTVTAALMLLHELGVLDILRASDEAIAPLQSTADDEARRYDWFRDLLTTVVPRLVSEKLLRCKETPIFSDAERAVNIVGIRSMYEWRSVPRLIDAYNDWICVVWIEDGRKRCLGWPMTACPGTPKVEGKSLSHLMDGQWKYFLGKHGKDNPGGGYDAPEPKPLGINWWNNKSGSPFYDGEDIYGDGSYTAALNIHAGNTLAKVGSTSEGCQVFYGDKKHIHWSTFIDIIKRAINSDDMRYTLLDSTMLPDTKRLL